MEDHNILTISILIVCSSKKENTYHQQIHFWCLWRMCLCDGCRGSIFSQASSTALYMAMSVCWLSTFPQSEILNSYGIKWIGEKFCKDIHGLLHGRWLFLFCHTRVTFVFLSQMSATKFDRLT